MNITRSILTSIILLISSISYSQDTNKTLIIFSADWCSYCKVAKSDMQNDSNLSEIIKNYEIIDIDYNLDKQFVEGYNVKTLPTFIIFQDGKEMKRYTGYRNKKELIKFLN